MYSLVILMETLRCLLRQWVLIKCGGIPASGPNKPPVHNLSGAQQLRREAYSRRGGKESRKGLVGEMVVVFVE